MIKIRDLVVFDVNSQEHLECFKQFLSKGKWVESCPFKVEHPWQNVPDMIKHKLALHFLNVEGE